MDFDAILKHLKARRRVDLSYAAIWILLWAGTLGVGVLYDVSRLCDISFVALIGSLAFLEGAGVRSDLIALIRAEAENEEEH
jgi:hypothetical protein